MACHTCKYDRRGTLLLFILTGLAACQSPRDDAAILVRDHQAMRREQSQQSARAAAQGQEAYRAGQSEPAIRLLRQAVELDDRNAPAWLSLGAAEFERGDLFEAAAAFDRAATLSPSAYEPLFNLGVVLETAGKTDRAIEKYEQALKLAPDQREVLENLARCCIEANTRLDRARECVDRALKRETRPEWRDWLEAHCGAGTPPAQTKESRND